MRILLCICISSQVGTVHYKSHFFFMVCDVIKQNETEVKKCFLFVCFRVLFRLLFDENPTVIGQLVPKIQTAEGLNKQ